MLILQLFKRHETSYLKTILVINLFLFSAPQIAPRNFKVTAESPYCVSMSYDPVLYPNGPESGLVYQVKIPNARH